VAVAPAALASQALRTSAGHLEGRVRPADGGAGRDLVGAQRFAMRLGRAGAAGEPWPMVVRQTISVGLSVLALGLRQRAATAATSWPSMGPITFQP
jgi:hypothetical protein